MKELRTEEVTLSVGGIRVRRTIVKGESFLPAAPPGGWKQILVNNDGAAYTHKTYDGKTLAVIVSACIEDDGVPWVHVSVSKRAGDKGKPLLPGKLLLPTWEDLKFVKNSFVGRDRDCIQVLPRESEFVNFLDVLHLFYRLDGERPCPDFTGGTGSI